MNYLFLYFFVLFESNSVADYLRPDDGFSPKDILRPKEKYDVEEGMRLAKDAVNNSPYVDMASYGIGAVVLFGALVIAVFFLIMILKR